MPQIDSEDSLTRYGKTEIKRSTAAREFDKARMITNGCEELSSRAGERSLDSVPAAGPGAIFGKTMKRNYDRYKDS